MSKRPAALAAGAAVALLVGAACLTAWRSGSPVAAERGGAAHGNARGFLIMLSLAFAAYLAGLWLLRRGGARLAAVAVVAVAVQLAPLASPLLLSTDAWAYWAYGWTAARGGESPYRVPPDRVPGNPAVPWMGSAWRGTTSVYGPAFTLASEPLAAAADGSATAAAWQYKGLAATGALSAALLAAVVARRRPLALAFVGWNPLLAVHLGGGGHNDAWVGVLSVGALALAASHRHRAAGGVWGLAVLVKWVPLLFLALHALGARDRRRRALAAGLAVTGSATVALASWRYGATWLSSVVPLAENAARETSYALPSRLQSAGVPRVLALAAAAAAFAAGAVWLAREARRGRARLGLAACLVLATTPYLAVWYLAWAVPLAAADEDRLASAACLALGAYLLPQTIPL